MPDPKLALPVRAVQRGTQWVVVDAEGKKVKGGGPFTSDAAAKQLAKRVNDAWAQAKADRKAKGAPEITTEEADTGADTPTEMYGNTVRCPKCGGRNPMGAKRCANCGRTLSEAFEEVEHPRGRGGKWIRKAFSDVAKPGSQGMADVSRHFRGLKNVKSVHVTQWTRPSIVPVRGGNVHATLRVEMTNGQAHEIGISAEHDEANVRKAVRVIDRHPDGTMTLPSGLKTHVTNEAGRIASGLGQTKQRAMAGRIIGPKRQSYRVDSSGGKLSPDTRPESLADRNRRALAGRGGLGPAAQTDTHTVAEKNRAALQRGKHGDLEGKAIEDLQAELDQMYATVGKSKALRSSREYMKGFYDRQAALAAEAKRQGKTLRVPKLAPSGAVR